MRYTQPNYTKLTQDGDRTFLVDEEDIRLRLLHLEDVSQALKDIRAMLEDADLPTNRKWIEAVISGGAKGLEDRIRATTEEDIKRLNLPKFSANQWRKSCCQEIDMEVWEMADKLRKEIADKSNDLPHFAGSLAYNEKDGMFLDTATIKDEIERACRVEVTNETKAKAQKILDMAMEVRKMELEGMCCLDLLRKYAKLDTAPALLLLFTDVLTRKHAPGFIGGGDDGAYRKIVETLNAQSHGDL